MSKNSPDYLVSGILPGGEIVEMVYRAGEEKTSLAVFDGEKVDYLDSVSIRDKAFSPYPARLNIISKKVVCFPEQASEYIDEKTLIKDIQEFIHSYLDMTPVFERIAIYYAMFTWVYDAFNELPYLRFSGDYGTGKSRFLKVIGSICYKPMFTSGATTVAQIFGIIDSFRGTLILDEADFRFSDTTAEITKILNSGYQKGNAVLRAEGQNGKYDIRPFDVFCPKIIATRKQFSDIALESRCLTEELDKKLVREDILLNIPESFEGQALELRNKLLLWRFRNLKRVGIRKENVDRSIEPRLAQIMTPLLSIIEDEAVRAEICKLAREYNQDFTEERNMSFDAEILGAILQCFENGLIKPTIKEIADKYNQPYSNDRDKILPRRMGSIIRRLKLKSTRENHGYVLSEAENRGRLTILKKRYGHDDVEPVNEVNNVNVGEQGTEAIDTQLPF